MVFLWTSGFLVLGVFLDFLVFNIFGREFYSGFKELFHGGWCDLRCFEWLFHFSFFCRVGVWLSSLDVTTSLDVSCLS